MSDRDDILENWQTQLQAMDESDTETLAGCFTPDAVLVHMTGYTQALDDWMAGMRARTFVYHRVVPKDVDVTIDGDRAELVGRVLTGVTDDGSGQTWRLRITQDLARIDGDWLCTRSVVTTW